MNHNFFSQSRLKTSAVIILVMMLCSHISLRAAEEQLPSTAKGGVPVGYEQMAVNLSQVHVARGDLAVGTNGTDTFLYDGKEWKSLSKPLVWAEVAGDGTILGADANNKAWLYTGQGWQEQSGVQLRQVSTGNQYELWGVSVNNGVMRKTDGSGQLKEVANKWTSFVGKASHVTCGGDGTVFVIGASDQTIYKLNRSSGGSGKPAWEPLVKPASERMGSPRYVCAADRFNIIFIDYQQRLWRMLPGKEGKKRDDWELLSEAKFSSAGIGSDGTIIGIDTQGRVLKKIPSSKDIKSLEDARGPELMTNQVFRMVSLWEGRRVWTLGDSPYDPQGTNPVPQNHLELLVGGITSQPQKTLPAGSKDPRQDYGSFFMAAKADDPEGKTPLQFGDTVEIFSLYASEGKKSKSGLLSKERKWWVEKSHHRLKGPWGDLIVSLVSHPNTSNGNQLFKIVSPYGKTGTIRKFDAVEIEPRASHAEGSRLFVSSSSRFGKNFSEILLPLKGMTDTEGATRNFFGAGDHSGAQLFNLQPFTNESDVPAHARPMYRSIIGLVPEDLAQVEEEKARLKLAATSGIGVIREIRNLTRFPLKTSVGEVKPFDALQGLNFQLLKMFTLEGAAEDAEIKQFGPDKIITLKKMLSKGIAWVNESLKTPGNTTISFVARPSDDGNVQVVFGNKIGTDDIFRIIIGAEENSKSVVIVDKKIVAEAKGNQSPFAKAMPGQMVPYWVSLNKNFLMVGVGSPGENIFLSCFVPIQEQPNRVGFSSHMERVEYTEIQFGEPLVTQFDDQIFSNPTQTLAIAALPGTMFPYDSPLRVPNEGAVSFKVQAKNTVGFSFENDKKEAYRIIIGAEDNKAAKILKNNDVVLSINTDNIPFGQLKTDGSNDFWISIDGGLIIVGEGNIGENPFLIWQDDNPLTGIARFSFVGADNAQSISNVAIATPVSIGAQKQKFSYKKPLKRFKYKGSMFLIRPYFYSLLQDDRRVVLKDKITGSVFHVAKTPQQGAKYRLKVDVDARGVPQVLQIEFPTESAAKIALEIAAEVTDATADATMQAAGAISGGMDPASGLLALVLKTGMAVGGVAAKAAATATKATLGHAYRSHDSYVFTEDVSRETGAESGVPPEAENNAILVNQYLNQARDLKVSNVWDFERLCNYYRDIISRVNHPYVVQDTAVKENIYYGLSTISAGYTIHPEAMQIQVMNLLIKAFSNPYLTSSDNKSDQSTKDAWYQTIMAIGSKLFDKTATEEGAEISLDPLFGEYIWHQKSFAVEDNGGIVFEAKAANDIFVGFAQEPFKVRNTDNQMYEVVLGGWENERHEIRIKSLGKAAATLEKKQNRAAMLSPSKFERYWIILQNGVIKIGKDDPKKGDPIGKRDNIIMEWKDPYPWKDIKYVGLSNWDVPITLKNIKVLKIKAPAAAPTPPPADQPPQQQAPTDQNQAQEPAPADQSAQAAQAALDNTKTTAPTPPAA